MFVVIALGALRLTAHAEDWPMFGRDGTHNSFVRQSLENVKAAGVEKLVQIEEKDIFAVDLRNFTVVMLYLGPTMNSRLIPELERMNPGARIVSHGFPTPGLVHDAVETFVSSEDDIARKLYVWTTPLKKEPKKD